MNVWLSTFAHDTKVHIVLLLTILDFILGVAAAFKLGTFRLTYVSDFLRNDIIQKLMPYFALYAMALVAGNNDLVIPGLDFGFLAGAAYVAYVGAMVASILKSLHDLGIKAGNPLDGHTMLFGAENAAPPKD